MLSLLSRSLVFDALCCLCGYYVHRAFEGGIDVQLNTIDLSGFVDIYALLVLHVPSLFVRSPPYIIISLVSEYYCVCDRSAPVSNHRYDTAQHLSTLHRPTQWTGKTDRRRHLI